MQTLERRSEAVIAERFRRYFRWRFQEALEVLGSNGTLLVEVLSELIALAIGEEEVEGWQPPALVALRAVNTFSVEDRTRTTKERAREAIPRPCLFGSLHESTHRGTGLYSITVRNGTIAMFEQLLWYWIAANSAHHRHSNLGSLITRARKP
jgi:hypothetical protein